jgi:hypothetical protein
MVDTTERPLITGIVSFAFTLCCPDYPFSKTATNLIIAEPSMLASRIANQTDLSVSSIHWFDRRTNPYLDISWHV